METLPGHIAELQRLREACRGLGINVMDSQFAGIIMLSMPTPSWDPVIGTLGGVLDPKVIISQLNTEWSRRQGPTSADKDANLVFQTETQPKCKNCRRMGHTETKCWAKGGGQEGQYPDWYEGKKDARTSDMVKPVTDMPIVWSHGSTSQQDIWFADSAATVHISPNQEDFTSYQKYDKCRDIKTFGQNTVKGISEGDILADISFRGKTKKIRLTNVMHVPSAEGKILSLKVLDQRGFESHITGGRICITKGTEVYAEASLGKELYEVKMKIVPAQETRADKIRREQTQSKVGGGDSTRPSGRISNKVLITRVTSDAPEIKIPKTKHEAKLEETDIVTCSREEEFTRDTHKGTFKPTQPNDTTSSTSTPDETALQQILEFQTSIERLKKKVAKLRATLDAEKTQPLDPLEKEKQNMTCTEHNLNQWPTMKVRPNDGWECKDFEDHWEEEGWIPNTHTKGDLETLVSEDPQSRQCNGLTIKQSKAMNEEENPQMTPSSSKAPKMSPNLEHIAWDADVASLLTTRRPSFVSSSNETRGHVTTRYKYPMEEWVSAESIYTDHDTYSGHHVNATTQEIEH